MPRVALRDVSVSFASRSVLKSASLELDGPAVVAITGPSGAGKTTLLHVLGRLAAPDEGSVEVSVGTAGVPAWVVQNAPLLPKRTAQENVAVGAVAVGLDWIEAQRLALSIMLKLGIQDLRSTSGYRLSGGEKQRVAVGRAIAAGAGLILADEPTASLDAEARDLVCDALRQAANEGSLVILTTHDPAVAARADLSFALTDGELSLRDSTVMSDSSSVGSP